MENDLGKEAAEAVYLGLCGSHLEETGETYLAHAAASFKIAAWMLFGGVSALVHSVAPRFCHTRASGIARSIVAGVDMRRRPRPGAPASRAPRE